MWQAWRMLVGPTSTNTEFDLEVANESAKDVKQICKAYFMPADRP
jgi:hypothetical protein